MPKPPNTPLPPAPTSFISWHVSLSGDEFDVEGVSVAEALKLFGAWVAQRGSTSSSEVVSILKKLETQGVTVMASVAELNAKLDEANATTNEIAADIAEIQGQLAGGVNATEAEALNARLAEHVTALKAVANLHPQTPPVEPPVEPPTELLRR